MRELAAPEIRTGFGAVARPGAQPIITYILIGICVVIYALQWIVPAQAVYNLLAYAPILTEIQPYRMLSSAFLHYRDSPLHLILNMYTLWIFGRVLEPVLGRLRYILVYLVSGIGGSVGFLLLTSPGAFTAVNGASGAVFGLFGALFIVYRQTGQSVRPLLILIGINVVFGFMVPGIAWEAHLGGLLTGAAATAAVAYAPRGRWQSAIQFGGITAVLLVLILLTTFRAATTGL